MICVTVTPTSRTLAKVDLLNAARQGDLVELCLDHLVKEPDVGDLISAIDKPILVSCRRPEDGGHYKGSEEERLMLLRQAIVAGPAYIELDLDIAPKIPRFGEVQRVISFTRLDRPENDIDGIFDEAAQHHADVVKFTWPTPTIDDAWPLLAAVSQKRRLPVVGMGLGRPELTFSLLGRKYGSPWIYAALERGMEAHPGQATVFELNETYHCKDINNHSRFVAVAGFNDAQRALIQVFNDAFRSLEMNVRCLPVQPGNINRLRKMLDALKIKAVLANGEFGGKLLDITEEIDKHDRVSGMVDLLLKKSDSWHGYNSTWRVALQVLEDRLSEKGGDASRPLSRCNVLVLGSSPMARAIAFAAGKRQGLVSICGPDDKHSRMVAEELDCRMVPFQNLYDTLSDVVIVADPALKCGQHQGCINPSVFKPHQVVVDVSSPPVEHLLAVEARERGCSIIDAKELFHRRIGIQFKTLTGKELPDSSFSAYQE